MSMPGNALDPVWNIDPTGSTACNNEMEALVNSGYAVFIPPARYRFDDTVPIVKAKSIWCWGHSLITGYTKPGDLSPEIVATEREQVRFVTNNNIDFFSIEQEQVMFRGGCFDSQAVSGYNKAALHVKPKFLSPVISNRAMGWGLQFDGWTALGNSNELRNNTSGGMVGVFYDFANQNQANCFLTHSYVKGRVRGCDKGFYHNSFNPAIYQWSNTHIIDLDVADTRTAIWDEVSSAGDFTVKHTASPIFPTQIAADSTPSVRTIGDNQMLRCKFSGFRSAAIDGKYHNSMTYDLGNNYMFDVPIAEDIEMSLNRGAPKTFDLFNAHYPREANVIIRNSNAAELSNAASDINNIGKQRGALVLDDTTGFVLFANANSPTSTWRHSTTTATIYTPA